MTRGSTLVGSVHAQGAHQRQDQGDTNRLEEAYAEVPPDMAESGQDSILSIDHHQHNVKKAGKEAQDVSRV